MKTASALQCQNILKQYVQYHTVFCKSFTYNVNFVLNSNYISE